MQNIKITPAKQSRLKISLISWPAVASARGLAGILAGFAAKVSPLLLAAIVMAPSWALAVTDVDKLELEGFKLGMTVDEVKAARPEVEVREVVRGDVHVGYEAHLDQTHISFTSKELGSKIFQVQLIKIYKDKPDPFPIYSEYVKHYGRPDFGGRQMMSVQACWGRCYGSYKRLEFSMSVVGFGNKPFPMTMTLKDPQLEKANHALFRETLEKTKSKQP